MSPGRRSERRNERHDDRQLGRQGGGCLQKWFRVRDSYGAAIDPGQDDVVILAVAVCIDEMAHEGR